MDDREAPVLTRQHGDQAPDRGGGIFPNRACLIRMVGMVLAKQDDNWQEGRRYFRPETMALIDAVVDHVEVSPGS